MAATILIRGAGDLASGVALRLYRVGLNVVMTELAEPLAVRRTVAFAEAVYEGSCTVEGVTAIRIENPSDMQAIRGALSARHLPIMIDPEFIAAQLVQPLVIVDARMVKRPAEQVVHAAHLFIGLGPGFAAPSNCDAVIETERGHAMGRVIWQGSAHEDSGKPDGDSRRVLRSPADGLFQSGAQIGQHIDAGAVIGTVANKEIVAPFSGTLRGLLRPGLHALPGMKLGDIDAREDPTLCTRVSDKALAVGGGILEAILTRPEVRSRLWA